MKIRFCSVLLVLLIGISSLTVIVKANQEDENNKSDENEDVIVHLPGLGKVSGDIVHNPQSNRSSYRFFDIRYAKPPSGELRFQPPVREGPWDDEVFKTAKYLHCPSTEDIITIQNYSYLGDFEDCLTVSVISPDLSGKLPVFVYLVNEYPDDDHEELFEYLYEKKMVFVHLKYRYNILGFLSTLSDKIPGNVGILDIIMGLEWIRNYIGVFGGDFKRITLFGEDQGASIAHLLTLNPGISSNLFQKVIYWDSSAASPDFITHKPRIFAEKLASAIDCSNMTNIEDCLINAPLETLLQADYDVWINETDGFEAFGGYMFVIDERHHLVPDNPLSLIQEKNFLKIPTLGCVVKHVNVNEYLSEEILLNQQPRNLSQDPGEQLIEKLVFLVTDPRNRQKWIEFAHSKKLFTPEELRNGTIDAMLHGLSDLQISILMKEPLIEALKANAEFLPHDTHLFVFDYIHYPSPKDHNKDQNISEKNRNLEILMKMGDVWSSFAISDSPDLNINSEFRSNEDITTSSPETITENHSFIQISDSVWYYSRIIQSNIDDEFWSFVLH